MIEYRFSPVTEPVRLTSSTFEGEIGRRLQAVTEQWILPTPDANPAILEMFRERDRKPLTHKIPWAGEFAGKYLTHSALIYAITGDPKLEAHLKKFAHDLAALQAADGYLGPWATPYQLGIHGQSPNGGTTWDLWGHYHAIVGLLTWYEISGDEEAFACARRIGDMLCNVFLGTGRRVYEAERYEMNMAVYHGLLLLYRHTGEKRYFDLAAEVEKDFETPPAGDYIRGPLNGLKFHETPQPRWESLHSILGIVERYFLDGGDDYRTAFSRLWWSMLEGDRHNNGGFSSGERATGNPYDIYAIETCCTVAWTAMTLDMLRLEGDSIIADELEFTLFNSGLGLMSPSGRWVTYDTPMDGRRIASAHAIVFQARPASSELNCCSVNGPRILGMVKDWALTRNTDGISVNYYGPCTLSFETTSANRVVITQETDYPRESKVTLRISPDHAEEFTLALRIPHWSERTSVIVNGVAVEGVVSGQYLKLKRKWQASDTIEIDFDFRLHYWVHGNGYDYADYEAEWQVFGPEDADAPLPSEGDTPKRTIQSVGGHLDAGLRSFTSRVSRACFVTNVHSERDDILPIIFSAGARAEVFVNDEKVYAGSLVSDGPDTTLRQMRLELPLRPGNNKVMLVVIMSKPHETLTATIGRGESGKDYPLASIYRGPLLLAFDHRYNTMDAESIPALDAATINMERVEPSIEFAPWLLVSCRDANGETLNLCDFASAGMTGNVYRSWLNVIGAKEAAFTAGNPLRSTRPA